MSTFGHALELPAAPVEHPAPGGKSRQPGLESQPPADVVGRFGHAHLVAAPAEPSAHSRPAGPAPTTSTDAAVAAGAMRSGCQPRRHSSPMVGFCVQRTGTPSCQLEMQMLQPMHSRISLLAARVDLVRQEGVGDRGARGTDQIEHAAPDLADHGVGGGEAADADHGLARSACFTKSMTGSWLPSGAKRDGGQSVGEESIFTSHRSGRSASSPTTSCASEGAASLGRARSSSRLIRSATAHLPPHRLVRHFEQLAHDAYAVGHAAAVGVAAPIPLRQQELVRQIPHAGIDVDDVEARLPGAARGGRLAASSARMSSASMTRGRWLPMKPTCVAIHEVPDGDIGAMRLRRFMTEPPPCHSSTPASAP